jgi:hypothetical protein
MNSLLLAHKQFGQDYLLSARASFMRQLEAFRLRISQRLKESLGVEFIISLPDLQPIFPEIKYIPFPKAFDFPVELVFFLFPMFIFKKYFIRPFLKELPFELEKNISRLAAVWTDAINSSIDSLAKQTQTQIEAEIKILKKLLVGDNDKTNVVQSIQAIEKMDL